MSAGQLKWGDVRYECSYASAGEIPPARLPEVSFLGRSNVGKSSLINALFKRKSLARTSSKPGKTAMANFFVCDGVHFVDLPGYGYAASGKSERERFGELIGAYLTQERSYNLVLALVDMRLDAQKSDLAMVSFLEECGFDYLVVLTKADKLSRNRQASQLASLAREFGVGRERFAVTSAAKGTGIEDLRAKIEGACC